MRRNVWGWLLAWQAVVAIACSTLVARLGGPATPPVPATPAPTAISTPAVTAAPSPAATESCDVNDLLTRLNSIPAYDEFAIGFELFQAATRQAFLSIWFVDPELDPQAADAEVAENSRLAVRHAAALVHQLSAGEACVRSLDLIASPVVVDRSYSTWFSGQVPISALPTDAEVTDAQLEEIGDRFVTAYLRDQPPERLGPAPSDSCSWPEAVTAMRGHFDPTRQNIGAQFVIDERGVQVYAQWEGEGDQAVLLAPLLDVTGELRCLYPAPDPLTIIVVDHAGTVRLVGILPGKAIRSEDTADDTSQLKIVVQR